jgi:hypothetical protein
VNAVAAPGVVFPDEAELFALLLDEQLATNSAPSATAAQARDECNRVIVSPSPSLALTIYNKRASSLWQHRERSVGMRRQ